MEIQQHVSLKPYNTFGIEAEASHFVSVKTVAEIKKVLQLKEYPQKMILGGGSNILLKKDVEALVVHNNLKGISTEKETDDHIWLKAAAGENWHAFVMYCVDHDYGGIENLSLIPGNVGTAPMQNIGAYGVEIKDTLTQCTAIHIKTGKEHIFTNAECEFGYRDSIFKNAEKGNYIIVSATFKLTKRDHKLHTDYGAISEELAKNNIKNPDLKDISDAVIQIRQSKLPDPKIIGNSGSFFKNPIVERSVFEKIQKEKPQIPFYEVSENQVKIPAGWLIEQAGFKGKRFGQAGVHDRQALVLVNHGQATGKEIWEVALKIQQAVKEQFGIALDVEVNVLG